MAIGVPLQLPCRRDDQPRPARQKTEAAKGRNRSKPAGVCERHYIQTAAEEQNPGEEQPTRAAIDRTKERKHQQRDRVNEMIQHGLVPNVEHSVRLESLVETMCTKRTQRDGEKTKRSCNPKKRNRHPELVICYFESKCND
jgi:hypothetical protein